MKLLFALLLLVSVCKSFSIQVKPDGNLTVLTVVSVFPEKDGETVTLMDDKNGKDTMIVSISNLGENYIHLKKGDKTIVDVDYSESYPVQIFPKIITKSE